MRARIRWKEGAPQGGGRNVWQPQETRWLISVKTNPRPAIRHPRPSLRALTRMCFVSAICIGRSKHARAHIRMRMFLCERKSVCGPRKLERRFPQTFHWQFSLTSLILLNKSKSKSESKSFARNNLPFDASNIAHRASYGHSALRSFSSEKCLTWLTLTYLTT